MKHIISRGTVLLLLSLLAFTATVYSQAGATEVVSERKQNNIFRPKKVIATDDKVKTLKVPPGFKITKWAEALGKPRMMAIAPDGTVYVTDRDRGTVTMLKDANNDGKADNHALVAQKENMHGIYLYRDKMYLITVNDVYTTTIKRDGTLDSLQKIISGLPDGGQHGNRTLAVGKDGQLYISAGSTCNSCNETNPENATLIQASLDGATRRIYAKGLRNTIGFDWQPQTGELWGFDHGIDGLGDEEQKEELNKINEGGDYGWPYVYEKDKFDRHHDPKGMTHEQYAAKTTKPTLLYEAHSAPLDFKFYTGAQFPAAYKNSAFVTMHGSWNRSKPSGYKVVRVLFNAQGQPTGFEDFITGFLTNNNQEQFGRICGLAIHPDGSLFISDDDNGVIYRVSYGK